MKKTASVLGLLFTSTMTFAQEASQSSTTFGGSADLYYKYDFSGLSPNGKTSFTYAHNSFELGMASIEASHTRAKGAVFVDLGFGNRDKEFTYNDNNSSFMIKQLYLTYQLSERFKLVAGSFTTHIGYELLDAVDNKNYSMSYAFTNGPFFNTGLKVQYTLGKWSLMAGLTNPTDFKTALEAGSNQKTVIGQLAYTTNSESLYFNLTTGSANPASSVNKTQFDLVASKNINEKMCLGFNGTYSLIKEDTTSHDENWFALVGYATYAVKDHISLAYRLEYFDAKKAAITLPALGESKLVGNTLSLNYKTGNLTIIPEIRIDLSSEAIFLNTDTSPSKSNAYLLMAMTYSF